MRVLLLGATGTIGRATAAALVAAGHEAICLMRRADAALPAGATLRVGDPTDRDAILTHGIVGERVDAVISCLASRTGAPDDAWAIDHRAALAAIAAAETAGIPRFVLLSAICVQHPKLAFQHAKLAAEAALAASTLDWTVVRPTAYFKSLSGQVARVAAGRPFLLFGDGRLTACKPISDADLAAFIVATLDDPAASRRILAVGGPGPAITPRDQVGMLEELLGRPVKARSVPVALLDAIIAGLSLAGLVSPRLAAKAELARIGRYYATESMLVRDAATGRYDADATPETGSDTLKAHYARLLRGEATADLGAHAVF